MYSTTRWNVICSEKQSCTFIHWCSKNHSTGTRMPAPAASLEHRVNYLISQPTLHKYTSCFSSGKWREERGNHNCLCLHCPSTGRNPALPLQPVADCPPMLTRPGFQPGYFSRTVSIKWSGNHGLIGTAWWNPAAVPHSKLTVTILESSVLKASAFCMLQVWGCQHTHPTPCQGSTADLHSSDSTSHGSSSLPELQNTLMALC